MGKNLKKEYSKRWPVNKSASKVLTNASGGKKNTWSFDSAWIERLLMLHHRVRDAVTESGREAIGSSNAKGDDVKQFDLAANEAALSLFLELQVPVVIDSEESERQVIGPNPPQHRLVLDPVDGSDNWSRGLPLSASSCAVLPVDALLHPDWVQAALVGSLKEDLPLIALKGSGAWRGKHRVKTSKVCNVTAAVISVELNHHSPSPGLARLMATAKGARSYGCASRALALVAEGATDAYVDERGRLTAESYLAGARMVIEAGGWVVGLDGAPMVAPENLTDRVSLVAASSRELCDEIVNILSHGKD